jgi:hypothetical protein
MQNKEITSVEGGSPESSSKCSERISMHPLESKIHPVSLIAFSKDQRCKSIIVKYEEKKLLNEDRHNLFSSSNIIYIVKQEG